MVLKEKLRFHNNLSHFICLANCALLWQIKTNSLNKTKNEFLPKNIYFCLETYFMSKKYL